MKKCPSTRKMYAFTWYTHVDSTHRDTVDVNVNTHLLGLPYTHIIYCIRSAIRSSNIDINDMTSPFALNMSQVLFITIDVVVVVVMVDNRSGARWETRNVMTSGMRNSSRATKNRHLFQSFIQNTFEPNMKNGPFSISIENLSQQQSLWEHVCVCVYVLHFSCFLICSFEIWTVILMYIKLQVI